MPLSQTIIHTNNLSKSYGEVHALKDLNLEVPQHSIVGFLGPNGAGKSTTIKLLLGLIQPTSGRGTIFGLDIVHDSTQIRQRVGYLSQKPRFYPNMTARETLEFVARFFYQDINLIEARVREALNLVGLENKANRPVKGFSGGEMQRLGIAQAQINYPDLLILDEPAAALDPMGRVDVLRIMERLREHTTIFYSTHILDDVQRVSDRVVILNHGELVSQGPIETLLNSKNGTVFKIEVTGEVENTFQRLKTLAWISKVTLGQQNGTTQWLVNVENESFARARLLREVLADPGVEVVSYGREKYELEDVFIKLVGEK